MFERYTESARRAIFFARYEASELGSDCIDTEHLLMGLVRENKGVAARFFRESHITLVGIRAAVEDANGHREKGSTSADIPLSLEAKRALGYAQQEAGEMLHEHIDCEHLLIGLLREKDGLAARILCDKGVRLSRVLDEVNRSASAVEAESSGQHRERTPRMGDIVHYHTTGERGLLTAPAIITSVVDARDGRVTLTVFHAGQAPTHVADARPGPLARQPEDGRWTWPLPD
jgi:ATP-dependent Clp protease ATP-binding subunit ClpA